MRRKVDPSHPGEGNPDILIYAGHLQGVARKELSLTTDTLLKTIATIINFDPASMFERDGTFKNIHSIPPESRSALKKIELKSKTLATGEVVSETKIEFYNKLDAINTLVRCQEIAAEKVKAKMSGKSVSIVRTV